MRTERSWRFRKGSLKAAQPFSLVPDVKKLVVLPLPYRTPDYIRKSLAERKVNLDDRPVEEAMPLFAAEFATGKFANQIPSGTFWQRNQRQLGFLRPVSQRAA